MMNVKTQMKMKKHTKWIILALLTTACGKVGSPLNGSTALRSASPTVKRVFITEGVYYGNMGGLSGADSICNNSAQAAGIGGTWKAWLSDSSVNAIQRIQGEGPWFLVDYKTVAFGSRADLVNAPLQAVNMTEKMNTVGPTDDTVWTGTMSDGTVNSNFSQCSNWTDTVSAAEIGHASNTNYQWTQSFYMNCSSQLHIYCFEQ